MNQSRRKIAVVFGTRPEAIKLAPVILALRAEKGVDCRVCWTGQHREMVEPILELFGIEPDADLQVMRTDQTLADLTARSLIAIDGFLGEEEPEAVVVQGDTTTVLAASLAAYYRRLPVGHVEAGLRTGDRYAPFPEEMNRTLVAPIAQYHFAPTVGAREALLRESVPAERVYLTGNTVIDALLWVRNRNEELPPDLPAELADALDAAPRTGRVLLVTGHRRESFGERFEQMCLAIRDLTEEHPDMLLVYPVHLNPNVQRPVREILAGLERVVLLDPLPYRTFAWMMGRCDLVLTDSGGVQEEAPALGKPVLVMRDTTERPEGVAAGNARLVGSDRSAIVGAVREVLGDPVVYERMARARNPYGDGRAARRIVEVLCGRRPEPLAP
ncbi:MAG TPA: UDP-N-acetylglucosamine 2-epimerase (non-hydrolyzing) [Candidatus Limnocylindrales bacterium]|nr:UDP-N-acetylglucosamine 2-epimerase (non-hydrolyzing) [Candidatus Limnocylindrales bacterium]